MKKTFNVVMLPTEKESYIHSFLYKLQTSVKPLKKHLLSSTEAYPQHLYIISDDEIKEGDWYTFSYSDDKGNIHTSIGRYDDYSKMSNDSRKIVATTDTSLAIKGWPKGQDMYLLPQLPGSFIQAYIKAYNEGKPITEVDLEMGYTIDKSMGHFHQERNYFIKTRSDNTVIVHQSKMYSRKDIARLIHEFDKDKCGILYTPALTDKWIEENLK